jgi:hypothetical protein
VTDTPRTAAYLTGTSFVDGQTVGSITPQRVRDFIVTVAPNIAGIDDPTNVIGLGAPAIIRGTVYPHLATGVTIGAGQTTTVRQANATALQACITDAVANQKYIEWIAGTFEINSSTGLVIPAEGSGAYSMTMVGSMSGTNIIQFYNGGTGSPVLTIGDITGGTSHFGIHISGFQLSYGSSQTGLVNSTPLVIGAGYDGEISDIALAGFTNPSYRLLSILGGTSGVFSMNIRNIFGRGFTQDGLYVNASGSTGNHLDNVYLSCSASGTYTAIAGSFVNIANGTQDWHFNRLNCEGGACNCLITYPGGSNGHVYTGLHCEGIKFTGFNPTIFTLTNSVTVNGFDLIDPIVESANMSGNLFLASAYVGSGAAGIAGDCQINNFNIVLNNASEVNTAIGMFVQVNGPLGDALGTAEVSHATIQCQGGAPTNELQGFIFWDAHLAANANVIVNGWGRYTFGAHGSKIEKALLTIAATYTHYGQFVDATILVPATITGFTITLSAVMGATGTQAVTTGNTVHVRRMTGSASGTLLVKDDAGTTLLTSTTAATDSWFIFNPTGSAHYVTFTPVT